MADESGSRRRLRPTHAEALAVVVRETTISVAAATVLTGQSDAVTRRAVETGDIRAIRHGRNWRVLSGPLRTQLGIDVALVLQQLGHE